MFDVNESTIHCDILYSPYEVVDDILDVEITSEEVKTAIDSQKVRKACGIDGIQIEIIKNSPHALRCTIHTIFNKIFCTGKFPSGWQVGVISPVFKKGNKDSVSNYRPITLLCVLNKIFTKLLCNSLCD